LIQENKKIQLIQQKKEKNVLKGLKNKRGSELAQTVLITSIMIVIIATLFFPQIQSLFTTAMTKMTTWFNGILNSL